MSYVVATLPSFSKQSYIPRAPRGWGKHGTAAIREEDACSVQVMAYTFMYMNVYVACVYVCMFLCMYVCMYVDVLLQDKGMQPVVYFLRGCVCDKCFMVAVLLGRIRCPW
jgi:hypothetical protein